MDKAGFLTIFPTYSKLEVVKQTLPSVIEETAMYDDARLIVHDSTEIAHGQEEKWDYLREMEQKHGFFLLLSTNLSMAHSRNMCLQLGQEMYAPDYICMIEDDHGFRPGLIAAMSKAMNEHYGKVSPNGLRFGLFSACLAHTYANLAKLSDEYAYPEAISSPGTMGGSNSCFRCAPSHHWYSVLKGYDTDEYLISNYQTARLLWRNYNKGFTVLFVGNGEFVFEVLAEGRGSSDSNALKLWDVEYAASDRRSMYSVKSEDELSEALRFRKDSLRATSLPKKPLTSRFKNAIKNMKKNS